MKYIKPEITVFEINPQILCTSGNKPTKPGWWYDEDGNLHNPSDKLPPGQQQSEEWDIFYE